MELARELSKDQSIPRKTEPLVPSDSWQQDWNREERTNTKVYQFYHILQFVHKKSFKEKYKMW